MRELKAEETFNQMTKGLALDPVGLVDLALPDDVRVFMFFPEKKSTYVIHIT